MALHGEHFWRSKKLEVLKSRLNTFKPQLSPHQPVIVIGDYTTSIKKIGIKPSLSLLQKSELLGPAKVLRTYELMENAYNARSLVEYKNKICVEEIRIITITTIATYSFIIIVVILLIVVLFLLFFWFFSCSSPITICIVLISIFKWILSEN